MTRTKTYSCSKKAPVTHDPLHKSGGLWYQSLSYCHSASRWYFGNCTAGLILYPNTPERPEGQSARKSWTLCVAWAFPHDWRLSWGSPPTLLGCISIMGYRIPAPVPALPGLQTSGLCSPIDILSLWVWALWPHMVPSGRPQPLKHLSMQPSPP